jgi:hypothetical protein
LNTEQEFIAFAQANMSRREYKRKMDSLYPSGWTYMDLADFVCRTKTGHGLKETAEEPAPEVAVVETSSAEDTVSERIVQYNRIFSADTPNDKLMLKILAENEATVEKLNRQKDKLIDMGRASSKEFDSVVQLIQKISSECRLIQRDFGIDKPSRGEGRDAGLKLMDYIASARQVLHDQSYPLGCPTCLHSEAKIKNLYGFLVWHLQSDVEWEFSFKCPRCGNTVTLNKDIGQDMKTLWGW